jgi:hypothetical protein
MDFHIIMMASNANHSQMDSIFKKNMKLQIGKLELASKENVNFSIWQSGVVKIAKYGNGNVDFATWQSGV